MRRRRSVTISQFDGPDESNVLIDTLTDPEPLPEELFERASLATDVRGALNVLKPRDQTILELRYGDDLSFEEIAKILKNLTKHYPQSASTSTYSITESPDRRHVEQKDSLNNPPE